MTEQTIPAEKVRELIKYFESPVVAVDNREAIRFLRALLPTPQQPTSGLLGRWAKHPERGDVVCVTDEPFDGQVQVFHPHHGRGGSLGYLASVSDLTFPEQTTDPEDVPAGEAWLVDVGGEKYNAVKTNDTFPWRLFNPERNGQDGHLNRSITLIAPLTPERPASDLQAKYDELEERWKHLDGLYSARGRVLDDLQDSCDSLHDAHIQLTEKYSLLETIHNDAKAFIESLKRELQEAQERIKTLEQALDNLRAVGGTWRVCDDEQPAWRIEAHNPDNFRVGEYIIDIDGDSGTVTPEWIELWDTDEDTFGARRFAPFIVFPNKDVATPEAIEEAKRARDKEMDK